MVFKWLQFLKENCFFGALIFSQFFFIEGAGQPVVKNFTPKASSGGSIVEITGTGFGIVAGQNKVKIGLSNAEIISESTTSVSVKVPYGIQFGQVSVTSGGLTGSSNLGFVSSFPGNITSLHNSQFEPEKQWALITKTESVIAADLTGDNKPEIIVTGSWIDGILIYGNQSVIGKIELANPVQVQTGKVPWDVTAADFNGDGWIDLAVCHEAGRDIAVLINKGTGNIEFYDPVRFACGKYPRSITTADFNLDGRPDIVVSNADSYTIGIYMNTTSLSVVSFGLPLVLATQNTPRSVITGDMDGDGKTDIAVTNGWDHTVSLYRNNSTSASLAFFLPIHLSTGKQPREVRLADIDQDGKLDLLNTNSEDRDMSVFVNNSQPGQFSFRPVIKVPVSWDAAHLEVADINGDGKLEVHAAALTQRTIFSYAVNGSGSLTSLSNNFTFRPGSGASDSTSRDVKCFGFADLDTDGKPDLFAISGQANYLTISRNRANEPLLQAFAPHYGGAGSKVFIRGARFTNLVGLEFGNGMAESFTVISDSAIEAIVGPSGTGKVTTKGLYGFSSLDSFVFRPVIDTFYPASAYAGQEVTISGKGFGTDNVSNKVWIGQLPAQIVYSSPQLLKVMVPNGGVVAPVSILSNGGTGFSKEDFKPKFNVPSTSVYPASFRDTILTVPGIRPYEISVGDLNNDGKSDWVISNNSTSAGISIFQNTSTQGKIQFKILSRLTGNPFSPTADNFTLGDLDGDGLLDIGTTISGQKSEVRIFQNRSNLDSLNFEEKITIGLPISTSHRIVMADLSGNGKKDIIAYSSTFIYIFQNVSTPGNLRFLPLISLGRGGFRIHVADFDSDGLTDIATYSGSTMYFWMNKSNQSGLKFAPVQGPVNLIGTPWLMADFDEDKKPDFMTVVAGSYYYYMNRSIPGNFQFTNEKSFTGPSFANDDLFTSGLVDINGDGKNDIISAFAKYIIKNVSKAPNVDFDAGNAVLINKGLFAYAFGDIDLDGKPDIIAPYGDGKLMLLRNNVSEHLLLKLCPVNSIQDLTSDLTGLVYQWQVRSDSNGIFQNIGASAIYQNPNARSLTLFKPPSSFTGYTFRCLVDGRTSREFTIKFEMKWNSIGEGGWFSSTWSCPGLPDEFVDIVIESGTVIVDFEAKCRTLTVNKGARVEVRTGGSITVGK